MPDPFIQKATEIVADHTISDIASRAFRFKGEGSSYWYSMVWTPGSISIMGDCGEAQFVHYNATTSLYSAMAWATRASHDYILGKSNLKQEYSVDHTAKYLLDVANDETTRSIAEYKRELARFAENEGEEDLEEPVLDTSEWNVWKYVYEFFDRPIDLDPKEREKVWTRFVSTSLSFEGDARETISDLEIDDFYGLEDWTSSSYLLAACLIEGAEKALEVLAHEHFAANPYEWQDGNDWQGHIPSRMVFEEWMAAEIKDRHNIKMGDAVVVANFLLTALTWKIGYYYGSPNQDKTWNKAYAKELVQKHYTMILDILRGFAKVRRKGDW